MDFISFFQVKKDLEDSNLVRNKLKEANKTLEGKVKEHEEKLTKNKAKLKSQKVQLEQLRKAQRVKEMEEDGAKSKTEVHTPTFFRLFFCLFICLLQ